MSFLLKERYSAPSELTVVVLSGQEILPVYSAIVVYLRHERRVFRHLGDRDNNTYYNIIIIREESTPGNWARAPENKGKVGIIQYAL